ncbi:NAD-dependent epimerase/dehydratase family protein [Actinophytocola sediminis]
MDQDSTLVDDADATPAGSAAVVGASGFLGSALVRTLRAGGVRVAEYTRRVPFLTGSGVPDNQLLTARTVFWLATSINPAVADAEPWRIQEDRDTLASMLRTVEQLANPPRIVLISSGGTVYDPAGEPPYREDSPARPHSVYGQAKLALEEFLRATPLAGDRTLVVRVANAYGPGQPALSGQGVIAYWMRALARGESITLFGDPATTRDFVYVDDIAEALTAIHEHCAPLPPVLNVGSGVPTALGDLVELVCEVTGSPFSGVRREPARGFDIPHSWLEVRLAGDVLGWKPRTTLRTGLAAAWADVRGADVRGRG